MPEIINAHLLTVLFESIYYVWTGTMLVFASKPKQIQVCLCLFMFATLAQSLLDHFKLPHICLTNKSLHFFKDFAGISSFRCAQMCTNVSKCAQICAKTHLGHLEGGFTGRMWAKVGKNASRHICGNVQQTGLKQTRGDKHVRKCHCGCEQTRTG